jgi:O-antigen/teichoic acid export membrane protein
VARSTLRQHADRQSALEEAFSKLLRDTALIAFPICTGATAVIPLFITITLDASWAPAIFPAQVLIIALMAWLVNYASSALLLATKHPQSEAQISLAQTLSTFVVLFAAPFGVEALCIASTVRWILLVPVTVFIVAHNCKIRPSLVVNALAAPFVASVLMGLGVALMGVFISSRLPPLAALPLLVTFGVVLYGLLIGFSERARVLEMMQKLRGPKSISA